MNHSYPEGKRLLLCISMCRAEDGVRKADPPHQKRRKAKQSARPAREGIERWQFPRTSSLPAMSKTTPLACDQKQPERQEVRPVASGYGSVKSGSRPEVSRHRQGIPVINLSEPGSQACVRKRRSKRAKRPHSKFSGRKALDGPAMRPATPLAVENGVGKLAANVRQMPAWERECGELPSPNARWQ